MLAPVAEVEFGGAGRGVLELGLRSARMWPEFAAELESVGGTCVGLRGTGTLVVARDDDEARELERQFAFRESLGVRATRMRASEAREREPALAPTVRLALHAPDDHSVDPRNVVEALRRACVQTGVELYEHRGALGVELDASETRVVGVRVAREGEQVVRDGERVARDGEQVVDVDGRGASDVGFFGEGGAFDVVYARDLVVAAGAWSGGVGGLPERAKVPVRPVKGQIMRLRDPAGPGLLEGVVGSRAAISCPVATGATCSGPRWRSAASSHTRRQAGCTSCCATPTSSCRA